jgi:hypothetical protein
LSNSPGTHVALALCVIGIVLTWFPANQRFASDLKVGRRS